MKIKILYLTLTAISFLVSLNTARAFSRGEEICSQRVPMENEWVSVTDTCKQLPLKNISEKEKNAIKQDLQQYIDKKNRIINELSVAPIESTFLLRCEELNEAHLKVREAECKLDLPASSKY